MRNWLRLALPLLICSAVASNASALGFIGFNSDSMFLEVETTIHTNFGSAFARETANEFSPGTYGHTRDVDQSEIPSAQMIGLADATVAASVTSSLITVTASGSVQAQLTDLSGGGFDPNKASSEANVFFKTEFFVDETGLYYFGGDFQIAGTPGATGSSGLSAVLRAIPGSSIESTFISVASGGGTDSFPAQQVLLTAGQEYMFQVSALIDVESTLFAGGPDESGSFAYTMTLSTSALPEPALALLMAPVAGLLALRRVRA